MIINIQNLLNINNPIIIDIRNNYYYNMGHIKNAISIPYYNLINKMAEKSIDKYFAVTPQCKNFLIDNYKINDEMLSKVLKNSVVKNLHN